MKQYQCHKVVSAFKIKHINLVNFELSDIERGRFYQLLTAKEGDAGTPSQWDEVRLPKTANIGVIYPEDESLMPLCVSMDYINKHTPKEGGYYVRYEDGYESWSPAAVFEKGYVEIIDP